MSEFSQHLRLPIESKQANKLTESDLEDLQAFYNKECELALAYESENKTKPEFSEDELDLRWSTGYNHLKAFESIETSKENNDTIVGIVRDTEGNIIGFSVFTLIDTLSPLDKVKNTYTGIAWNHQGTGIGKRLLSERHKILLSKGVTAYNAHLWGDTESHDRRKRGSRGLFQKLQELGKVARLENLAEKVTTIYLH